YPGAQGHRNDRRDHVAWPCAADRWPQGEAVGGPEGWPQNGADPEGQREGPRRHPGQREEGIGHRPGHVRRRGREARAGYGAYSDRVDRAAGAVGDRTAERRRGPARTYALIARELTTPSSARMTAFSFFL